PAAGPDDGNRIKGKGDDRRRTARTLPEAAEPPAGVPILKDIPYLDRVFVVTQQPGKKAKAASTVIQMRIGEPLEMKVALWPQAANATSAAVETPARVNLEQGTRSGLKLFDIPNRPGQVLFASVLIPKLNAEGEAYVTGNAVPLSFTDED